MAALENDPVPSVLHPITNVGEPIVDAPTRVPAADASDPPMKENQTLDSTNTQLATDGGVTSLPEVTKLSPEELVVRGPFARCAGSMNTC